jgi:hypothetical protein
MEHCMWSSLNSGFWAIHVNKMHDMRKHVFSEDLAVLRQGCSVACGECDPVECLLYHVYTWCCPPKLLCAALAQYVFAHANVKIMHSNMKRKERKERKRKAQTHGWVHRIRIWNRSPAALYNSFWLFDHAICVQIEREQHELHEKRFTCRFLANEHKCEYWFIGVQLPCTTPEDYLMMQVRSKREQLGY